MRGVIILAGGEGSRCGAKGAKGMIPLLGKSLFERICEKVRGRAPLAILTSSKNRQAIFQFFQENHFFGIEDLSFFSQGTLPLLNDQGEDYLDPSGAVVEGSDGNGSLFEAFASSGVLALWEKKGVKAVHVVPVDNPIADPLDPLLVQEADLTFLCIKLSNPEEPLGRFIQERASIVEFAELTPEQRRQELLANTGIYAFSMPLMHELANKKFPIHKVWRSSAWKREKFIVDALAFAKDIRAIPVPREQYYAALKEKSSIPEIERLLLEREGRL